jgi:hypothetical protein
MKNTHLQICIYILLFSKKMLEDYIKELENDLKIDELNLKDYQLRLPALKHKWAGRMIRLKLEVANDIKDNESLKKLLTDEIQKTAPVKLSLAAISSAVEKHTQYKQLVEKISHKKLVIELLEKTEKTLSSTTFDIKNIIEIMKLEIT